jgi:hypothetical protein
MTAVRAAISRDGRSSRVRHAFWPRKGCWQTPAASPPGRRRGRPWPPLTSIDWAPALTRTRTEHGSLRRRSAPPQPSQAAILAQERARNPALPSRCARLLTGPPLAPARCQTRSARIREELRAVAQLVVSFFAQCSNRSNFASYSGRRGRWLMKNLSPVPGHFSFVRYYRPSGSRARQNKRWFSGRAAAFTHLSR